MSIQLSRDITERKPAQNMQVIPPEVWRVLVVHARENIRRLYAEAERDGDTRKRMRALRDSNYLRAIAT